MIVYFVRRLIEATPAIILSTIAVFLLLHLLPGDPAQALAGTDSTPETLNRIRLELGLNEPLPVQYGIWVGHVIRGDLGTSVLSRLPVSYLIGLALPATLELTICAMLATLIIGVPLGIFASLWHGTRFDWAVLVFNGVVLAVPGFWLSILSILLFALILGWLPASGFVDLRTNLGLGLKALILPSLTLALPTSAGIARQVRAGMLEVLEEDYVRTARAKGLAHHTVVVRHALRNAMLPVATVVGLQFGRLLGGAVITESVFTFPGVGRLLVQSIGQRDYTVVQGTLLLFIIVFTVINLLTDLSYVVLDPRIRLGGAKAG